ncbi:MalY/PatB family protein [Streptococcus zalophi]|uniref:MalY/PatB family protein n=1 Tax=Streptococcus zalophi TaxID=640031 RepID=UPI00215BD025|nr:MalY/PatB family protein [Streptococcus zalophi]MCR8967755.1 pyridoxal phosphate-dependent aminotransferase [Streptococcus zalophi]
MTHFDFTENAKRIGQNSIKWQLAEKDPDIIPAWVADMDFKVFPGLKEAIENYSEKDFYGYGYPNASLADTVIAWEKKEHNYIFSRSSLLFINDVISGIATALQVFTQEGDAILINDPVYPAFKKVIEQNKRQVVTNTLVEKEGQFVFDLKQFEADMIENEVKLFILCNPHNPGGRVWDKETLLSIGKICQKHGVIVVSDEIHQDLTLFGHKHHSFNTVDDSFKEFSIILSSPSKTFNMAALKIAFAIIENRTFRKAFQEKILANHQSISNIAYEVTETVYQDGKDWLLALRSTLEENITFVTDYFAKHAPKIKVMSPQGTYLLWLDFSKYQLSDKELYRILKTKAKVILNEGLDYGEMGKSHARLNVATSKKLLEEIVKRIVVNLEKV